MEINNLGKSINEIFDNQNKYIIPLYQRNFSWRREHIEQLLQDIYAAFNQNPNGHYYIGSLVVLKRSNGDLEVIDGQQRLTVLSLITKILGINKEPRLFYDSRPEVEEFFKMFYNSEDGSCNIGSSQTAHLKNAIDFIKEIDLDAEHHTTRINEANEIGEQGVSFCQYFKNNVILVRVEIPQDTDVASYFEIMNNRGEQLQKHEILKSFLLSKLERKSPDEFSKIWTACSQMDTPIQKLFVKEDRHKYFGDNYTEFRFEGLTTIENNIDSNSSNTILLDNILDNISTPFAKNDKKGNGSDDDAEGDGTETKFKSIIDFPNFLMHVFKVIFPDKDIPLNEKYLLDTYHKVKDELNSDKFIKTLFFCRTIFDRYVVKTSLETDGNNKSEDGEKWCLIKPITYEKKWDYVDTFGKDKEGRLTSNEQNRIVKALSMLQVSYRTRMYKNWLYEILRWFCNDKKCINKITIEVEYTDYLRKLDEIILDSFNNIAEFRNDVPEEKKFKILEEGSTITKENSYSKGLSTPHFLFNFIDYLYWVDSKKETSLIISSNLVRRPFDFKYWNSIEHHLAQQFAKDAKLENSEDYIDNLGTLCLIRKSSNSRLSDRSIEEKITRMSDENLGANRQVIYAKSKDPGDKYSWDLNKIKEHYNEILDLLSKRNKILNYND